MKRRPGEEQVVGEQDGVVRRARQTELEGRRRSEAEEAAGSHSFKQPGCARSDLSA